MDLALQHELAQLLATLRREGRQQSGLVYGPPIKDWRRRDIAGQQVALLCDGKPWRTGSAALAIDNPMVPVTWLANELSRTSIRLRAGEMISTGTLSGMLAPRPGETYIADFGPFGSRDGELHMKSVQMW